MDTWARTALRAARMVPVEALCWKRRGWSRTAGGLVGAHDEVMALAAAGAMARQTPALPARATRGRRGNAAMARRGPRGKGGRIPHRAVRDAPMPHGQAGLFGWDPQARPFPDPTLPGRAGTGSPAAGAGSRAISQTPLLLPGRRQPRRRPIAGLTEEEVNPPGGHGPAVLRAPGAAPPGIAREDRMGFSSPSFRPSSGSRRTA